MTLVRKKLPKSGWILLALIAVGLILLPVLHFTGVFDLTFLGDLAISIAQFMALSGWNVLIGALIAGGVGFGICYVLKDYIIGIEGNNLQVTSSSNSYVAQERISTPAQDTVVST